VNVESSSVDIRKPLVVVVTLRAVYLDACYVGPFRYLLDCGFCWTSVFIILEASTY